ncbi:hypothetical protein ACA910_017922 [Epithemia clementina (nom. ined.)]
MLQGMGWSVVEVSDTSDASALEAALQGSKVVVSTLGGGDLVEVEKKIVQAAKNAGASLFVPSHFGIDHRKWGGEHPFLTRKQAVLDTADQVGLPTLSVSTGFFADWSFGFFMDLENGKVTWIGDGNDMITWTSRSDIGYVLAKALADPKYANGGHLSIQGDYRSFNDATKLLGDALGKTFTVDYMDPEQAKKQEAELLKKGKEGDVSAFLASFKMHLMGEPARGNKGCDLSADFDNYGVKMQSLEDVFKKAEFADASLAW